MSTHLELLYLLVNLLSAINRADLDIRISADTLNMIGYLNG